VNSRDIREHLHGHQSRKASVVTTFQGTRQIRVILYAKGTLHGATAPADELSIEDILTVKHDVIPLDGADMFQQGSIDSIGDRVALAEDPGPDRQSQAGYEGADTWLGAVTSRQGSP
jgi:hypothetical protein